MFTFGQIGFSRLRRTKRGKLYNKDSLSGDSYKYKTEQVK